MRASREKASAAVRVRRPVRGTLPAAVDAALAAPGKPLDPAVRRVMEGRLGHDFGDVRVHADMQAATAARLLDADAFTSGPNIVFGEGRYQPDDEPGKWLIAHELVHTLQQGVDAAMSLQVSTTDTDPLEREADSVAERVVAGDTLPAGAVSLTAPAARGRIARRARAALERLPAEVPDSPEAVRRLADDIARLLAFEPGDRLGRVKRRLARLAQATRTAIAHQLAGRIPDRTAAQLRQILTDLLPPGTQPAADAAAPAAVESEIEQPAEAETGAGVASPDVATGETPAPSEAESEAESESQSESQSESDTIPQPTALPEGPVAEPALEGEVAPVESESAAVPAVEPGDSRATAETIAPVPSTEAPEAEEEAADTAPVDDTEAEALEAHDEVEAEDVDEAVASAPSTAGSGADAAREGGAAPSDGNIAAEVEADDAAADAGAAAPTEASAAREEAGGSLDESFAEAGGEPPSPEQEPDLAEQPEAEPETAEEAVVEPLATELRGEDETSAEPPDAETEGVEQLETGADAGTEQPADPQLAGEESTPDEEAPIAVGGDEGAAAPIEEPAEPETPDLSAADPAAAMEVTATLPPAQSEAALTGVEAAASRSVDAERQTLADQPPEIDRPTGAPSVEELAAEAAATEAPAGPARLQRSPEPPPGAATRVEPLPPTPPPVAARAQAPQIAGGPQGELGEDGRRALQASLRALPVHDPALEVSPGTAPAVTLEGAADPQRAHGERDKLETAARTAIAEGRREIVKPAGEQRLVPQVPAEHLRANIPTPPASEPTAAPTAAAATLANDAASMLAREKRGEELRAAAQEAAAGMRAKRSTHAATAHEERRRSQEQVTHLVRDSAAKQAERRADARGDVHTERQRWSTAEHELAEGKLAEADTKLTAGVEEVARLKTDADEKAATHIETGEREADTARQEGEKQAAAERKRGEKESSGVLGWLADRATAFFDEIKAGVTKAFEIARTAVRAAIERAKNLAAAAIDRARAAIVTAIRLAGDALIAIGDKLLAGFPGVRDRFRRAIEERVAKARAVVNALAEGLKNAVQKALDGLGAVLDAALGLLAKGLLLMVDGYRAAVAGALKWADGLVKAFGAFAVLVRHVAVNPTQWLRNLAASAKDGVRNHLWKAFQAAIKRWFWEKVEEVLGLGITVWNLLKKGGLSLARIGTMAWETIKTAIPPTLIQILVEKLISLLIPAAAAVMLIIETLQAAWGTIQRVLEAFERFFTFLKAVRTGMAGPQFANAIAAAAVAVIDFVANWLLKRLRKPAGRIAKKLKALAKKLGKKLAKVGKKLFGRKRRKPKKLRGKATRKPKPDKRAKAERRVKAASEFLSRQLTRALPRPVLWLQMQYARARWRVRVRLRESGERATLSIEANPLTRLALIEDYKRKDIEDYRERAARYQGFIREGHQIHHIFTRTHKQWWEAVGIDWNSEEHMLEVPSALHLKILHGDYRLLDAARGRKQSGAIYKNLRDGWNVSWARWFERRIPELMRAAHLPPYAMFLETASRGLRKRVRDEMRVTANGIVKMFSTVLRTDLWRFRLRKDGGKAFTQQWAKPLAKFQAKLAKQGIKGRAKLLEIRAWKAQRALARITPKAVLKLLTRYRKGTS